MQKNPWMKDKFDYDGAIIVKGGRIEMAIYIWVRKYRFHESLSKIR